MRVVRERAHRRALVVGLGISVAAHGAILISAGPWTAEAADGPAAGQEVEAPDANAIHLVRLAPTSAPEASAEAAASAQAAMFAERAAPSAARPAELELTLSEAFLPAPAMRTTHAISMPDVRPGVVEQVGETVAAAEDEEEGGSRWGRIGNGIAIAIAGAGGAYCGPGSAAPSRGVSRSVGLRDPFSRIR